MSDAPVSLAQAFHSRLEGSVAPSSPQRVLLVEPDVEALSRRALRLTSSSYVVTVARNRYEVLSLRRTEGISIAVLSDALGPLALQAVAVCVRRQWPLARILILQSGQSTLEDNLYDEMLDHQVASKVLLDTLATLSEDPWNQRKMVIGFLPDSFVSSNIRPSFRRSSPSESDPTKKPRQNMVAQVDTRNISAGEWKTRSQ